MTDLHGVFPYLVSPVDGIGRVKAEVLGRLVDDLVVAGVHGLTPLGSTGEFAYLGNAQRSDVVRATIEAASGRVPVIAGVAATATADAVAQARSYQDLGADGVLAILESYFPLAEPQVEAYFRAIADAVDVPVVIYTNPQFQRTDLTLNVIARLSEHPRIQYIKDASTNTGRLLSIMNRCARLKVFSASAHIPAAVMLIGGVGWRSGLRHTAAKRCAIRALPRRPLGGGDGSATALVAHQRDIRASIWRPASRPRSKFRVTMSAIQCRRSVRLAGRSAKSLPRRWLTSPIWPRRDAARGAAATFVNLFQPILNASLLNLPPRRYRATRGAEVVVASIGSHYALRIALERTVSAIASARRAVLADRYPINSFAVEWRWFADLLTVVDDWRDLAARAFEPNVFYEPAFALAAAAAFGRDAGAVLVWSGTSPRKLLGFFPARLTERRYGLRLPVLVGWTHPYGPLGTPLVEREAAEPVIAAWLAHLAGNPALPGLLLLPLLAVDGPFATTLGAILRRVQMPCADFGHHTRALLEPGDDRAHYLKEALSPHRQRELRRTVRRLADLGALLFTTTTEPAAVAAVAEDFLALEASGWKGEAGTAAACYDEVRGFLKTALPTLAAEGKVAIDRLLLDGRAIAAAITLRSGDTAWYWKTAYDETLARYAPGMLLSAALTEQLAEDTAVARTDSCAAASSTMLAAASSTMLDPIWRERLSLGDRLIAVRPEAAFARGRRLETLRRAAIETAKSIRDRFRGRR